MQKIRKILRAVSEKTALPTNQLLPTTPILQDLADAGPTKFVTFITYLYLIKLTFRINLTFYRLIHQKVIHPKGVTIIKCWKFN